jgi:hypothetical protein
MVVRAVLGVELGGSLVVTLVGTAVAVLDVEPSDPLTVAVARVPDPPVVVVQPARSNSVTPAITATGCFAVIQRC